MKQRERERIKRNGPRENVFLVLFFLTYANIHFLNDFFPGRTSNVASGQHTTSPEKTVTLPRSSTLSGQSMSIDKLHEFACMHVFLGNDGGSEGRTIVARSASAVASMFLIEN